MRDSLWNSRFETGIEHIDAQHKSLFEAVDRLATAFEAGKAEAEIKESLDFLAAYTLDHFEAEERLMREEGFPGLDQHKAEHDRLLVRVGILQGRLAQGIPVEREVATLLAGWLKHHIANMDMTYVPFMKAPR